MMRMMLIYFTATCYVCMCVIFVRVYFVWCLSIYMHATQVINILVINCLKNNETVIPNVYVYAHVCALFVCTLLLLLWKQTQTIFPRGFLSKFPWNPVQVKLTAIVYIGKIRIVLIILRYEPFICSASKIFTLMFLTRKLAKTETRNDILKIMEIQF